MPEHIKDLKNYQWYLWESVGHYPLWSLQSPLVAFLRRLNELYGVGHFRCIFYYKNRDFFMYNVVGGLEEAGKKLWSREEEEKGFLLSILDEVEKFSTQLLNEAHALFARGVEPLSNNELADEYSRLYLLHEESWVRGQALNLLEHGYSFLGSLLKKLLAENGVAQDDIASVANILTKPRRYSFLQKEEQDLLALVPAPSDFAPLEEHWKKYAWLDGGWTGGPGYTLEYFTERLELLKRDPNWSTHVKSEDDYMREIEEKRASAIERYQISEYILYIALIIERIILMKAYRVDASWYFYWVMRPMFTRIAREHGLSLAQTWFLKSEEIVTLLRGGSSDANLLNKRSSLYAIEFHDGEMAEYFGDAAQEAIEHLETLTAYTVKDVTELVGDTGSPGKARGVVKVVNTPEDMAKMEEGNILVSHMTNPRLVPAMKLAAAIVADIGGVTCHAAIVSRELGIPCVIGTKIATRALKDGMTVEVDADRGNVKILSS